MKTRATRDTGSAGGKALPAALKAVFQDPKVKALFEAWGREGGKARARKLSPEQRRTIAKKAIEARWARQR